MNTDTITIDVRDDIRNGREPFSRIMNAASGLQTGQQLLLLAPFEPVLLFDVLAKQGFAHSAQRQLSGDWEVRFVRGNSSPSTNHEMPQILESRDIASAPVETQIVNLDARGLEPPLPLVKILEAVASLPLSAELNARTDRRPLHLYVHLEERGFSTRTEEQTDGSFITHIFRR